MPNLRDDDGFCPHGGAANGCRRSGATSGFVLALATIAGALLSGWTLVRGRWPRVNWWFVTPYRLF